MIHDKDIFVSDVTVNGKGKQNVGEIKLMKNHDMYFRYEVVYIISNLHIFLNRFVDNYLSLSLSLSLSFSLSLSLWQGLWPSCKWNEESGCRLACLRDGKTGLKGTGLKGKRVDVQCELRYRVISRWWTNCEIGKQRTKEIAGVMQTS